MELPATGQTRPRNGDWKRAAALLYGDWGTSKAYVTGIAFAIALYSSFWFVLAVGVLMALVGLNYMWVCKYFPEGGGVYSSAKAHSRTLALVGGFLLVADYIVTASLSCYDAYLYLGFSLEDAKRWAILTIFIVGAINFFGPRHSGSLAVVLGGSTFVIVVILGLFCVPHLPQAVANLELPHRDPMHWWAAFVGVVLALSGVEAIANTTGVMNLDPGSTPNRPKVAITARKAILPVMLEVCVFTTLFGLAMLAIKGMDRHAHEGDMLRYMGQLFVDEPMRHVAWLSWLGDYNPFSVIVGVVFGGLLLSATNTAIVALVSVLYLMAKDDELPRPFSTLNRFGVPWILMLIAILAPILVIDVQPTGSAVHGLAEMYAIGVVGAIAINLGSCALNFKLPMRRYERGIMLVTFIVIAGVEITIAATKHTALAFAVIVIGLGFMARALHKGTKIKLPTPITGLARRVFPSLAARAPTIKTDTLAVQQLGAHHPVTAIMVAARGVTPTLRYAVDQARAFNAQLFVLFVREVFTTIPVPMIEAEDEEAQAVFHTLKSIAEDVEVTTIYAVSEDSAWTILDNAAIAGVDLLILGHSRRGTLTRVLRGDLLQQVSTHLPEEIQLVIVG